MNLLYLPAAIPVGFFKVRVIISCCIFMSKLCLAYVFVVVFGKTHSFVTNRCVLWLQSRSCFTANFCYLTLSSVY